MAVPPLSICLSRTCLNVEKKKKQINALAIEALRHSSTNISDRHLTFQSRIILLLLRLGPSQKSLKGLLPTSPNATLSLLFPALLMIPPRSDRSPPPPPPPPPCHHHYRLDHPPPPHRHRPYCRRHRQPRSLHPPPPLLHSP